MPDTTNTPHPITPVAVIHRRNTPQAPKKPKAKFVEYLKPSVYKPKGGTPKTPEGMVREQEDFGAQLCNDNRLEKPRLRYLQPLDAPQAPKAMLDALSRAGVRKDSSLKQDKVNKAKYPAPRKLTVSVVDGKTDRIIHKYVPTRLLMAVSSKAAEVLEAKPWAGKFKIYGKHEPEAMNSVIYAIILSQKMPVDADDLGANLLKYEACLRLGVSTTHPSVKPLFTAINNQISTRTITSEVLTFITYRLGSKDPVFKHMANVLCHQRFTKSVPDVKAFEKMVAKKPALQKAMVQIDQAHKARRATINASKQASIKPEAGKKKEVSMQALAGELEATLLEKEKRDQGAAAEEQRETLLTLFKDEVVADESGATGKAEMTEKTEKIE